MLMRQDLHSCETFSLSLQVVSVQTFALDDIANHYISAHFIQSDHPVVDSNCPNSLYTVITSA